MFLMNAWYVGAKTDDVQAKPLGRRICGEALVFYRSEDGAVHALEDFCPHRGAPLSLGFVKGDRLVCGYHGLEMGCAGKTLSMPGQRVGGFPAIRRIPVVERHGYIWVWPGDPAVAAQTPLPEFEWMGNPAFAYGGGMLNIQCGYQLMIDNLMDLTHETYVHATSIGQPEIDETPCTTRVDGEHVTTSRFMSGIQPPPFWQNALRANGMPVEAPVDRWQICHFDPPSHIMIEVGVALAGQGGRSAPDSAKAEAWVVDFITPETETSIWYFWGLARKFKVDDAQLTDQIRERQGQIFAEDRAMLESQQRNLLARPDRKLLMLNIDSGGVQARKLIERRLTGDRAAAMA